MKRFQIVIVIVLSFSAASAQSWQWGKRGGSSEILNTTGFNPPEQVNSIATDSQKNIYILSSVGMSNMNFDGIADSGYADPNAKSDKALVSFSCDGTFRWSKIIGGGGVEEFQNIQVDSDDNVYIAGKFGNSSVGPWGQHIDDDVTIPPTPVDYRTLVIIKFDNTGQLLWYKRPEPQSTSIVTQSLSKGLQIDSTGNLYWLVYLKAGTYADGAFSVIDDGKPWYVLKYNNTGTFLNATHLDLYTPGALNSMQFFRNPYSGNLFFTARASTNDGSVWATVGTEPVTHSIFLSCYSPNGQALWKRENASTSNTLVFYNLVFDTNNDIYLAGSILGISSDTFMALTVPEFAVPGFIMKLDANATNPPIWETHHNKGSGTYGAIVLNGNELGFTNFCTSADFIWGSQTLNAGVTNELPEVLFARFDKTSGECLSLAKIQGNFGYEDYGSALAVDASGDYIVGGNFASTLTFDGGQQITSAGGNSDFFVAKYATSPCSPMAVSEFSTTRRLQVYPNPADNRIGITVDGTMRYEIVDVAGQVLKSGEIMPQNNTVDIEKLSRGFYLLNLYNAHLEVRTIKFLKR